MKRPIVQTENKELMIYAKKAYNKIWEILLRDLQRGKEIWKYDYHGLSDI